MTNVYCYGGPLHDQHHYRLGNGLSFLANAEVPRKLCRLDTVMNLGPMPVAKYTIREVFTANHEPPDRFFLDGLRRRAYVIVEYWYVAVCEGYQLDAHARARSRPRSLVHRTEHRWKDTFELIL